MDKALKQRLVGATVLIALAVIVLPMMLGGPPEGSAPQSQKIELPPRPEEVNFETRRFPLGEQSGARNGMPADTPPVDRQPAAMPPEQRAPTEPQALRTDPVATAAAEPANSIESRAGEQDMPPPAVTVEEGPDVEVQPATDTPVSPPPPEQSADRYVVQVASLGSDANARKLMQTLQHAGFPVLLDTVESDAGRLSRVRVGPYDSQSVANDAINRIRQSVDGVNPRLVDLRPKEAPTVTNPADSLLRWVVQVGSFSDAANAESLVGQLRADGLSAYRETVTSTGSSIHRVRVGPFLERDEALGARQKLIDSHSLEGVVMSAE
jgi:DedD protein